jgi:membrane protease YdiL (CAAX protease family)
MKLVDHFKIFRTVILYTTFLSLSAVLYYFVNQNYYPANKNIIKKAGILWFIILIGAPIFEELIFRYPLKHPKYYFFVLVNTFYFFASSYFRSNLYFTGILLLGATFIVLVKIKTPKRIEVFFEKYFLVFFLILNLIFALIHLSNYELGSTKKIFYVILIFPQFVSGLLFGYFRMRFGFIWCIFSHFYHNLIVVGLHYLINSL